MVFSLNSVGSFIDANNGMVFPMLSNGKPDVSCGTHISDVDKEWFDNLSSIDKDFIDLIFGKKVGK
jgi:hypothetical protein